MDWRDGDAGRDLHLRFPCGSGESFESFSEGTDTASVDGQSDAASTNAAPAGEVSDVLKRLMQKREQELK